MTGALKRLRKRTDYAEHGGAPLLGVDGVALICHGGSNATAMQNAVYVADRFAQIGLGKELSAAVARHAFLSEARRRVRAGRGGDLVIRSRIVGTGRAVPPKVLTNDDLSRMVDTSDAWIVERTGIRERHILEPSQAASDLATEAGRAGLPQGGRRSVGRRLHHRRHRHRRLSVPGHRHLRAEEAGRAGRAAAPSICRRPAPASSTGCRSPTPSSASGSSRACW